MTKQELLDIVQALPDEVTISEFIADLEFRAKVEERLAAVDRGETVSHEEAVAHLRKWRQK